MSKKVYIAVGHGGSDPGAVKYIKESEYTLKTAFALAEYLSEAGVDYKMNRTQDVDTELNEYIKECNAYNPDLVISIHFNAGGGSGFEVYHYSGGGVSKTLAENINTEVKKIFNSRGIKTRKGADGKDYFGIIRDTNAPAVLCEGGFVDNEKDAEFIRISYKQLAKAYANGILKTLGVSATTTHTPDNTPVLDSAGFKLKDAGLGVFCLKCLLLIAKKKGLQSCGMDENGSFGNGTKNAVNALLKKWKYRETGVAGFEFVEKLFKEIMAKL